MLVPESSCLSLEQNWPFARNSLCRKFVKRQNLPLQQDWPATIEGITLIDFQRFLQNASRRDQNEISSMESSSRGRLACGEGMHGYLHPYL